MTHGTHYNFTLHDDWQVCGNCSHSRIERHTGDEQRVCWVHEAFGLVVADGHFCGYWKARGACQTDGKHAAPGVVLPEQEDADDDVTRPLYRYDA